MWYWHLLAGFMYFLGVVSLISSWDMWQKLKRGNSLQFVGLLLFLGGALVYALH